MSEVVHENSRPRWGGDEGDEERASGDERWFFVCRERKTRILYRWCRLIAFHFGLTAKKKLEREKKSPTIDYQRMWQHEEKELAYNSLQATVICSTGRADADVEHRRVKEKKKINDSMKSHQS